MLMRDFDGRNGSYDVSQNMSAPGLPQNWHQRLMKKATSFRDYLSTSVCACISSVPTFALIVVALVLVMLLIASVPLAFAYSYMNADGSVNIAKVPKTAISPIRDIQTPPVNSIQPVPVKWYRSSSIVPQNISLCKGFGFTCADQPSHVIGTYQRCDGVEDCRDGSDEMECNECHTTLSCFSKADPSKKHCLRGEHLCDGTEHCFDGEDEKVYCNDACEPGLTKCNNANVCYSNEMRCDGDQHCPDGDDEANCSDCNNDAVLCALTSECIPKWNLCDGQADCPDKMDEKNCDCKGCSGSGKVLCEGSQKVCIEKSKICDGNNDCSDGEDEEGCPGTCNSISKSDESGNETSRAAINLKAINCDGVNYDWRYGCGGGFTACEGYCKECYTQSAFDCNTSGNSTRCIHRSLVCNGVDDCGNGRDEANCDCSANHMTICSSVTINDEPSCFSSSQRCDGYSDCPTGEDENDCDKCTNNSFYCEKDKRCVPSTSRCDGVSDCSDHADEMNCTCEECNAHPFKTYMCASGSRCYRLANVCTPYSQCPNANERDKFYCAVRLGSGFDYL